MSNYKQIIFEDDILKKENDIIGARMMGGGFGGCTLNIIKKAETAYFLAETKKAYKKKFGYDCTVIKVKLSQGTQLIN